MDFLKSIAIAASGLRAQAGRMRVISENVANADSTAPRAGANPYRRKVPTFRAEIDRALDAKEVALGPVRNDPFAVRISYRPRLTAADANGYVRYPDCNSVVEMT